MSLKIKVGAFFITDAHYSNLRPHFLDFLKDIKEKRLNPSQLILMGDIFDMLFGGVPITYKNFNKEAVALLNDISKDIEVIYLEGNHDFNLKDVFPFVNIIPISSQPLKCEFNSQIILLAHGDIALPLGYKIYTSLIRNRFVLFCLNIINGIFDNFIIKKLDKYLSKKNDCNDFKTFEKYIQNRLEEKYKCDIFIEGHFHQNRSFIVDGYRYINLGAFACNQRYFTVKSTQYLELCEEKFSKG
jgi:UDP-2,3-diacylglucosamine hydrolase